jgi:putative transcriptional regulator
MNEKQNRTKSRIFEEMTDTVKGLHKAGVITKKSMEEFKALRHLEVKQMTAKRIK